jgi:hypothetical protein
LQKTYGSVLFPSFRLQPIYGSCHFPLVLFSIYIYITIYHYRYVKNSALVPLTLIF